MINPFWLGLLTIYLLMAATVGYRESGCLHCAIRGAFLFIIAAVLGFLVHDSSNL